MVRPKIMAINYYHIFPVNNGGKLAVRDFYMALSEWFDVTLVCLVNDVRTAGTYKDEIKLNDYFSVVALDAPEEFFNLTKELTLHYGSGSDLESILVLIREGGTSSDLIERIRELSKGFSIIVSEHVYAYRLAKAVADGRTLVYRAHNVEYDFRLAVWNEHSPSKRIYDEVFALEKNCCMECDFVFAMTEENAGRFHELYGVPKSKVCNISAGYDAGGAKYVLPSERRSNTKDGNLFALYISSDSLMAVEAANEIIRVSDEFPNVTFTIAGSVGRKLSAGDLPPNVSILGLITDDEKRRLLETFDFALNPITGGSGLNIKMLEYFASGLPVICTEFGARGLSVTNNINCIITDISSLAESISSFLCLDVVKKDSIALNAYDLYMKNYTWRTCAIKAVSQLQAIMEIDFDTSEYAAANSPAMYERTELPPNIPDGDFYVYGAGDWGRKCIEFLAMSNRPPIAILDSDPAKWGMCIGSVLVQNPTVFLENKGEYSVVFALNSFKEAIRSLLSHGLEPDRIFLAPYGICFFHLASGNGNVPFYFDEVKIRTALGL